MIDYYQQRKPCWQQEILTKTESTHPEKQKPWCMLTNRNQYILQNTG